MEAGEPKVLYPSDLLYGSGLCDYADEVPEDVPYPQQTTIATSYPTTVSGKVIAMWMPIMVFFAMTFEHSVVNMFLFPSGLLMGGNFSVGDYLVWNEIPTVLGNLVGGLAFTGLTLYSTHVRTGRKRVAV